MQGKKLYLTPEMENRIIRALISDEKPTLSALSGRFGVGKDKIKDIKRRYLLSRKESVV